MRPSKVKLGDDAHRERAHVVLGDVGHDRRGAGAGAAALARGDEDHVGAGEGLLDLVAGVLGGLLADLGVGARAEALGDVGADVDLDVGVGDGEGLRVGVDGDELDTADALLDHAVHGVGAAAAHANDLDHGEIVAEGVGVLDHRVLLGTYVRRSERTTLLRFFRPSRRRQNPKGQVKPDAWDKAMYIGTLEGLVSNAVTKV